MSSSTRRIAAIAGAVAVMIVLVWYFALMRPQLHNLAATHKAHQAAEAKITQLGSEIDNLEALVKQKGADTAHLNALEAALPDTPSLDSAVTELHLLATATGVQLTSVSPSTPSGASGSQGSSSTPAPGGPTITLGMNVSGTYAQMMSFLRALSSAPRVFVVDRLNLSGGAVLDATIGARIFYAGSPTP